VKVILTRDVDKLGARGDMVDVSDGHARNYLLPRGLAVPATGGNLRAWSTEKESARKKTERQHQEAIKLAEDLASKVLTMEASCGAAGKLFGAVTNKDIAEIILRETGLSVERKNILLEIPIKRLGTYKIPVKLHSQVTTTIELVVTGKT